MTNEEAKEIFEENHPLISSGRNVGQGMSDADALYVLYLANEKQIPHEVIYYEDLRYCPICDRRVDMFEYPYCPFCGNKLEWKEWEE